VAVKSNLQSEARNGGGLLPLLETAVAVVEHLLPRSKIVPKSLVKSVARC
jgi:hypothetical protein